MTGLWNSGQLLQSKGALNIVRLHYVALSFFYEVVHNILDTNVRRFQVSGFGVQHSDPP